MELTARFRDALALALRLHQVQVRKGTEIPYAAHLLGVCALVLEDGGDEDEAIAALLHDAAEDQGGMATLNAIRRLFGSRVAEIVEACTDTMEEPKPEWRRRKEEYLARLRTEEPGLIRVSLADKVHNARAILVDYRELGEPLWSRFTGGREGTLWYYRELVEVFRERRSGRLANELERVVQELDTLAAQGAEAAR